MKKHALILLVSAVMLSCNFGEKAKAVVESVTESARNSPSKKDDAIAIIEFNNSYIKMNDKRNSRPKYWDKYVEDVYAYIHRKDDRQLTPTPSLDMDTDFGVVKEVPSVFGDDQEEMQKNLDLQAESYKAIRDITSEIRRYVSSEDYKDDGGKKFEELADAGDTHVANYYAAQKFIYEKLDARIGEAEEIVLEGHPMRDEIVSSKSLLATVEGLLDVIGKQYNNAVVDQAEIQKLYDEAEEKLKSNQKLKIDETKVQKRKQELLETYNKAVDEYLGSVRKLVRNANENGQIDSRNYDDIYNKYLQTIRAYGNFVG
ncbi:MAG: DUF3829 domain-containing protein [Capnocytophaga sp.]|nr:DUF3829 domain-containing protein [Capnocytophaga sp.]